jgi:nucleotide-binding universal stress UspA family protein
MNSTESSSKVFRKILFCTDFSENADFAFDYALNLAKQNPDCALYLLHVVPESEAQFWKGYIYEVDDVDQKAKQDIEARLNSTYRPRIPPEISLHTVFKVGKDYQEILNFAKDSDVDLIVIGRRGQGAMQKAFFGNVTEKVARHAPCAVLIIPLSYQEKITQKK